MAVVQSGGQDCGSSDRLKHAILNKHDAGGQSIESMKVYPHGWHIKGRRQIGADSVQQRLHPLVLEGRPTKHGHKFVGNSSPPNQLHNGCLIWLFTLSHQPNFNHTSVKLSLAKVNCNRAEKSSTACNTCHKVVTLIYVRLNNSRLAGQGSCWQKNKNG